MKTIDILLADDHVLVRSGFKSLIQEMPGMRVIGEAGDGREAVRLALERRPRVVLMDIGMPELNGLEALVQIRQRVPACRVVLLSMHAQEEYVLRAVRAGASGYLLKESAPAELELAIRAAARGQAYLSPAVSSAVLRDYLGQPEGEQRAPAQLSARQREILQLIAEGHSNKEIAAKLGLSTKTVETHRAALMERLGIHDLAGLVRYAIRRGIASPER